MVGNQLMSDITIFVKDEHEIPAHSLVFHVQCPDILNDVITEESGISKSKKMLMWLEYSYEACLAFLKLIYSGLETFISPENRKDYLLLGTRYNILITLNDNENPGWFSEEHHETLKRKSQDSYSSPTYCKRYKASTPDMFMSNDISEENYINTNFLGTIVNDEKSSSVLRTQQWLDNCYTSPQNHLSFTENLSNDVPPLTILPEKSPSHSFHSALTVCLPLSSSSNHSDENIDLKNVDEHVNSPPLDTNNLSPKSLSSGGSSIKAILILHNPKNIHSTSTPAKISTLTNSCKKLKPELITIDSDSESGSVNMIFPNKINNYWNSNNVFINHELNKNNCTPLSRSNTKKKSLYSSNNINYENNINVIELNDDGSESIHSACTNVLYQGNRNTNSSHSVHRNLSMSNMENKKLIHIDDESSVYSAATNLLSLNNSFSSQVLLNNNNHFIDLVEDSSDSVSIIEKTSLIKGIDSTFSSNDHRNIKNSTSFSNVKTSSQLKLKTSDPNQYPSCSTSTNIKENENLNSGNSFNSRVLHESNDNLKCAQQSFQLNNISSDFSNNANFTTINIKENHDKESNETLFDEKNDFNISYPALELLEYTKENKISKDNGYLIKTSMETANSCLSSDYINKDLSINPINIQDEPTELSGLKIACKETWPNEKDESIFEQIIDDPWMDYLQPVDYNPHILSNSKGSSNESPTPTNSNGSKINYQKKNAVTPNKYGSKINTPKSLRRIRSESIIGSKEQVTPLPDYSSMKTPDFRVSILKLSKYFK